MRCKMDTCIVERYREVRRTGVCCVFASSTREALACIYACNCAYTRGTQGLLRDADMCSPGSCDADPFCISDTSVSSLGSIQQQPVTAFLNELAHDCRLTGHLL